MIGSFAAHYAPDTLLRGGFGVGLFALGGFLLYSVWYVVVWSIPGVIGGGTVGARVGKHVPSGPGAGPSPSGPHDIVSSSYPSSASRIEAAVVWPNRTRARDS